MKRRPAARTRMRGQLNSAGRYTFFQACLAAMELEEVVLEEI
jgi:hypothetical protein